MLERNKTVGQQILCIFTLRKERQKFVNVKEGREWNKTRKSVTTEERSHRD